MPRTVEPTAEAIAEAVKQLKSGRVVVFPTETVYGLGADTRNPEAVAEIYRLKGRPADNPLIAHVAGVAEARAVTSQWSERADRLARRFWPGPLTMVLPRGDDISPDVTSGLDTIAVRAPRHPVAQSLLTAFGGAISAPSANRSGHVSPTSASHVAADFAESEDLLILDGGRCRMGLESTVVDLTLSPPRVLRPGFVTITELLEEIEDVDLVEARAQLQSPGTSETHYAPRTPASMVTGEQLPIMLGDDMPRAAVLCFDREKIPARHLAIVMPQGAGDYARRLYAALRDADEADCDRIVVEQPPLTNELWCAVHDRLRRATSEP